MDKLIEAIDAHGFVFWICPHGCKMKYSDYRTIWNEDKSIAKCNKCSCKFTIDKKGDPMTNKEQNFSVAIVL